MTKAKTDGSAIDRIEEMIDAVEAEIAKLTTDIEPYQRVNDVLKTAKDFDPADANRLAELKLRTKGIYRAACTHAKDCTAFVRSLRTCTRALDLAIAERVRLVQAMAPAEAQAEAEAVDPVEVGADEPAEAEATPKKGAGRKKG